MELANIVRLSIYSTDVDEAIKYFDVHGARLGPVGVALPMTLLGTNRLVFHGLMFEIEAKAAD